jgi:hypothetical protein
MASSATNAFLNESNNNNALNRNSTINNNPTITIENDNDDNDENQEQHELQPDVVSSNFVAFQSPTDEVVTNNKKQRGAPAISFAQDTSFHNKNGNNHQPLIALRSTSIFGNQSITSDTFGASSTSASDQQQTTEHQIQQAFKTMLYPPQFPGSKISAFGIVASAVQIREQIEAQEARRKELAEHPELRKRRSSSPLTISTSNTGAVTFTNVLSAQGTTVENQQTQQTQNLAQSTTAMMIMRRKSTLKIIPPPQTLNKNSISSIDILGNVEMLLPKSLFAPEATWLEVRAVLLSKMNEEEFRIVTMKCLNPR